MNMPVKPKLLIVEDDEGLQRQLRWAYDDYEVLVASDRNAAVNLLNVAPGVNSGSGYGGSAGSGNALLLDGVDTRDPEGGTAWTFFNYNIIDEVQIGGLGQPATTRLG